MAAWDTAFALEEAALSYADGQGNHVIAAGAQLHKAAEDPIEHVIEHAMGEEKARQ